MAFSRRQAPANVVQALAGMADDAAELTGAARVFIWLHDRRTRDLRLAAQSGGGTPDETRVAADDAGTPAGAGPDDHGPCVRRRPTAPPSSRRCAAGCRALGTMVLQDAAPSELSGEQVLELAHHVARHLSAAIENLQLLEQVVRQHRLLHEGLDSLVDPVIVTGSGRDVVQTNDAARRCLKVTGDPFGTPLSSLVGGDIAAWATARRNTRRQRRDAPLPGGPGRRPSTAVPLGDTVVVTLTT